MVYQAKISIMEIRKSQLRRLFSLMLLLFAVSFTVVAQDDEGDTNEDGPCQNRYGDNEEAAKKNLSLFNQYIQSKEYHKAYPYYQYLLIHAPCVQKRVLYSGAVVVKSEMANVGKTDPEAYRARFKGLRDTLFLSHQKRIEYWGQEGYVKGKWANDIATYDPARLQEALDMFRESVDEEGYKTDDKVPAWYMSAAAKAVQKEVIPKDSLFPLYFKLTDIIMYNKAQGTGDQAGWKRSEDYVNATMQPHLSCDKLEEFFKPRVEADPENLKLKKDVTKLMSGAGCESSLFYLGIAEDVVNADPSAEAFISLAKGNYANGKKGKAKDLYKKALDLMEEGPEKTEVYDKLTSIYYSEKNYSQARTYANKVIQNDPNNGKAYLVLAGCYASMRSGCTADNLDGGSVMWLAYDMAAKAAAVDTSVSKDASKAMAAFRSQFVKKSDAFFKGFTKGEGESFTVPCVGVATTVRYRTE